MFAATLANRLGGGWGISIRRRRRDFTAALCPQHTRTNLVASSASPSSNGTVAIVTGGISYLPNPGFSGADVFTYLVTGDGGTSTATVRIAVSPTSAGDVGATVADQPIDLDVLANDIGTGLRLTDPGTPSRGTTSIVRGRIRYLPTAGFSGTDSFSYSAADEAGAVRTTLVTVFVSPVSAPDTVGGSANAPLVIDLGVNDIGSNLRVSWIGTPSNGSASIQRTGTVSFTPPTGWSGIATMEYTTTDWAGLTSTSLATITIRPTASPDAAKTPVGTAVSFPVLGNDVGTGLRVTSFTKPAHGTMVIAGDGMATFSPDPGWFGLETLSYTTTDAEGSTATTSLSITVTPIPSIGLANTGRGHTALANTGLSYRGLAYTGADPWSMVAIGILLLMLGALIVIVGRRNRTDP